MNKTATIEEVESFLSNFHVKMKIFSVVFRDDRGKNIQSLLDLEITPTRRSEILAELKLENYSQGPLPETIQNLPDMWVFGFKEKNKEIYIKITMGKNSHPVICISFHMAEHEMKYPFKTN